MANRKTLADEIKDAAYIDKLPKAKEELEICDKGDGRRSLLSKSTRLHTIEAVLAHAKIDTSIWKVVRPRINSWECAAYDKENGGWTVQNLFQVRCDLEPVVEQCAVNALEALVDRLIKPVKPPKIKKRKPASDPHLVVAALFDAHFGKMAWKRRSGQDDNLALKHDVYIKAVDELLAKTSHLQVEQFDFPVGHDFYHVDSQAGTTTGGTPVDWNGLVSDMIEVGIDAVVKAVERLLEVAPVRAVYVGGNHDRLLSLMLMYVLRSHFRTNDRFAIDCEPITRKYVRYGCNLIGYAHGDLVKLDKLFELMPMEMPSDWAEATCYEWLTGHGHRSEVYKKPDTKSKAGQVARMLCSISGTDAWHYDHAFINGRRAAEAYIYSKARGYAGHVVANVEVA